MDLRINQTGIRSNEFITANGKSKQNKGAIIEIQGLYPASRTRVTQLTPTELRDGLNTIPFFSGLGPSERSDWLLKNGTDVGDMYINDVPNLKIKIIKMGDPKNSFYQKLGQDVVNTLLQGNPKDPEGFWPITEVMAMFPRKPGSRTRPSRVTLIFRPSMWSLMIPERLVNQYTGVYLNLNSAQVGSGAIQVPQGGKIYSFELESKVKTILPKLGIVVTSVRKEPLSEESLFKLASKYIPINVMNQVKEIINWFSPSMHKSLIQKLIRTRCDNVEYGGKLYPAPVVLLTSFSLLLLNPGVFVPNIRRFVTGIESAAKRLAVSIHEDSYLEPQFSPILTQLYAAAMIGQDDRNWLPTNDMINGWFAVGISAQRSNKAYQYDFRSFDGKIKQFNNNSLSYIILSEIRSFQSDIDMVGSIAQNQGNPKPTTDGKLTTMPLIHCLDHHSLTEIAHYMPYTGEPYSELFSKIWNYVVGVNPRYSRFETYYPTMEQQPFVQQVRSAQRDVWISKMYKAQTRPTIPDLLVDFSYKLDISWLAGLVGPIEIKMAGLTAIVVMRVDNIYEFTAIKRPQRDTKANPELTEKEQIQAIAQTKKVLSGGVRLVGVPSTLPLLGGAIVKLVGDEYIITLKNQNNYRWETLTTLTYKLPLHTTINPTITNSLLHTGDGIDQISGGSVDHIFKTYNIDSIRRLSTYLTGYKSCIELAKISRDGSGTYYKVVPEDTAVHHILCYLCIMYPAAIVKTKNGFRVKNGPLLWTVRDSINSQLGGMLNFERKWAIPKPETRKRWEHQIDSVRQMVDRNKAGKKGHLIWIKVGLGKTLITIDYLDYLINAGKMPPYCVYALPASAINNIIKEFELRGIPTKLIDARQASPKDSKVLSPYKINLIKHDHMRLGNMEQQLKSVARQMVYIVDEFHKTLAKTQRTSIALELSRLSYDFVGMSGTIIKDTNYDELIQWLEQIVEFEVTEKNYWVAIGALVSRKVYTKVVVDRQVTEVPLGQYSEQYYKMVPEKLGGTARQIDFRGAVEVCYKAVTESIVNNVFQYVKLNEGVFVVAKDIKHQGEIRDKLVSLGLGSDSIHLFGKDNQITLTPEYNGPVKVVITTKRHSEGYTLTKFRIMITSVYFSNQATREQLEGRINRIGQVSPQVRILIYHTGILTYIHQKYEKARTLAAALKGFAGEVGVDYQTLKGL